MFGKKKEEKYGIILPMDEFEPCPQCGLIIERADVERNHKAYMPVFRCAGIDIYHRACYAEMTNGKDLTMEGQ